MTIHFQVISNWLLTSTEMSLTEISCGFKYLLGATFNTIYDVYM